MARKTLVMQQILARELARKEQLAKLKILARKALAHQQDVKKSADTDSERSDTKTAQDMPRKRKRCASS